MFCACARTLCLLRAVWIELKIYLSKKRGKFNFRRIESYHHHFIEFLYSSSVAHMWEVFQRLQILLCSSVVLLLMSFLLYFLQWRNRKNLKFTL